MRILEIVLLAFATLWPFFGELLKSRIKWHFTIGFFLSVLFLHFVTEGWRWQMLLAYLIGFAISLGIYLRRDRDPLKWGVWRVLSSIPLFVILILAWTIPIILPVFELPEPSGKYRVGTTQVYLKTNRPEEITEEPNDKRELAIKMWYPTTATQGKEDLYIDRASRRGFERKYGVPSGFFDYLDLVNTSVLVDVHAAEGSFPVLVFSHGYNSKATGYYALLSEIVSQGYIIININHTYESPGTTLSNGQVKFFDQEYASRLESDGWALAEPIVTTFNERSFEERHPDMKMLLQEYFVVDLIKYWVKDVKSVLDAIPKWQEHGLLAGHLNLDEVGVFGHSRGGSTAGTVIFEDERVVAAANLDGAQWGYQVDTSYQKPFLYLSSDWPPYHQDVNQHAYINKGKTFYDAKLLNSGHSNFMDIPLMISLRQLSQAGSINEQEALEVTSKLLTAFFDKHLKNMQGVTFPDSPGLNLEVYQN